MNIYICEHSSDFEEVICICRADSKNEVYKLLSQKYSIKYLNWHVNLINLDDSPLNEVKRNIVDYLPNA